MVERLDKVADESSNGWNNAGTGHSALCELNYTPVNKADGKVEIAKAVEINEQFQVTRQFLSHQVDTGILRNPRSFINSTPHMNLVWGDANVAFLQKRHAALQASPLFSGMEFTTDPKQISQWVPVMMEGRAPGTKLAATRSPLGTDCDWGEVTRQYIASLNKQDNFTLTTGHEVRSLERETIGGKKARWRVTARDMKTDEKQIIKARFVFAGAGGGALPILQKSGIPEADDYAGFPVGGSFLVADKPAITHRHLAKVYGKAAVIMSDSDRMDALREYFPGAKDGDWRLWQAGQRVQIIKRDPEKGGVLRLGTEIVASKDGSIAALLGASPGASTAPSIMLNLLKKVFPNHLATAGWQAKIREIVPTYGVMLNETPDVLAKHWTSTADTLQLAVPSPTVQISTQPRPAAMRVKPNRSPDLAL